MLLIIWLPAQLTVLLTASLAEQQLARPTVWLTAHDGAADNWLAVQPTVQLTARLPAPPDGAAGTTQLLVQLMLRLTALPSAQQVAKLVVRLTAWSTQAAPQV